MIEELLINMMYRGATKEELDILKTLIKKYYPEWLVQFENR